MCSHLDISLISGAVTIGISLKFWHQSADVVDFRAFATLHCNTGGLHIAYRYGFMDQVLSVTSLSNGVQLPV